MTHSVAVNASSLTYFAHYRLITELNLFITIPPDMIPEDIPGFLFSPRGWWLQ